MADALIRAFLGALDSKADKRAPSSPGAAVAEFGWSTRDLAQRLGVSERTARRYRQHNAIPARRRAAFDEATRQASRDRARARIVRRGLSGLSVQGFYQVSRSRYRTNRAAPVRILPGNAISGSAMRDVFAEVDAGDLAGADELLSGALAEGYGMSGPASGEPASLTFQQVESLEYVVRHGRLVE